jgi:folate-binding protein YgfZ
MISLDQYRAVREGAGLVDRTTRGRLRLTGTDRRDYLQGLLTNDITALTPGTGCYAALLTAQGRMIADMYVVETGEVVLLDLEREVTGRVLAHLEQFVITEDVQVEDITDATAQLGVFGPAAADVVSKTRGTGALDSEAVVVPRDDLGVPGFDFIIDAAHAAALAQSLRGHGAVPIDPAVVDVVRVEAGRPVFLRDMTEDTIPLEAGIEDRAISLTKGCYVGQEIIIRVLHRGGGRVARRLVGLTFDESSDVPTSGARIRSAERDIGWITSAVRSPALQRPIALGYVHRDFVEAGTSVGVDGASLAVVTAVPFVAGEKTEKTEKTENTEETKHGDAE